MAQSLQQEIDGDAPVIAKQLFGDGRPDQTTTTDSEAGTILSEAYHRGDRPFLLHLARANPSQFLRVWKGLGGTVPPNPGTMGQGGGGYGPSTVLDPSSNVNAP